MDDDAGAWRSNGTFIEIVGAINLSVSGLFVVEARLSKKIESE